MNFIPVSAEIQHMEAANDRKLLISNYRRRIWLSRRLDNQPDASQFPQAIYKMRSGGTDKHQVDRNIPL
jgi:hypothetical protein